MQRTESVEYIKQNLILHIKGIVIKWTYEKLLSEYLSLMASASSCIYFLKGQQKYVLPEGAPTYLSYNSFSIILYPDRTALKYCVPKRETKRGIRSFLKHLFFNSFNLFFTSILKRKLKGKILDLSSFFIFMFLFIHIF